MAADSGSFLEQALALCESMQTHAAAHQWELVAQVERRRRRLIEQALAAQAPGLEAGLRKIMAADERIKAAAAAAREDLVKALAQARAAHKAARAYRTVER